MLEFINYVSEINYWMFFGIYICVLLSYLMVCKRFIFNIFDPLMQFVVFNSFSITLVIYLFVNKEIILTQLIQFLSVIVLFWLGYAFIYRVLGGIKKENFHDVVNVVKEKKQTKVFFIMAFLLLGAMSLLYLLRGVPALQANPSDAKVLIYEGGFGPVRFMTFSFPMVLIVVSAFYLLNVNRLKLKRRIGLLALIYTLLLFFVTLVVLGNASKSSLLIFLVPLSLHIKYLDQTGKRKEKKRIYFYATLFLTIAVSYAILISFLTAKYHGDSSALLDLGMRFIASGDTYFFYYRYDLQDSFIVDRNIVSLLYFWLSPILSQFRLVEPQFPLGSYLLHYATGYPLGSFGPNAQLPVVLGVYTNPILGGGVAFIIGAIASFLRFGIIKLIGRLKSLGVMLWIMGYSVGMGIFVDTGNFILTIFMMFFYVLPIWFGVQLLYNLFTKKRI